MGVVERNISVVMVRENLEGVPQFELPPGFGFSWFEPGDEEAWVRINDVADRYNTITRELFFREYGDDAGVHHDRICFIENSAGEKIATASAWFNDSFRGGRWGRVHWVAVIPQMQGRGLSKPLMSAVCNRLRELGERRAYLVTSTARVPAISLYLRFGFKPDISDSESVAVWKSFFRETGLGAMTESG